MTELCWDGEMNRGKGGERVTCCGFTAHPSRLAFPGDVEKVRLPWSVAAAEIDFMMTEVSFDAEKRMLRERLFADDCGAAGECQADEGNCREEEQGEGSRGRGARVRHVPRCTSRIWCEVSCAPEQARRKWGTGD